MMEKCIIVAVADNGAIGRGGTMPWHIAEDLRYFKRQTTGFPVIMGRTTFESLGKPLPGRKNIVLSRSGRIPQSGQLVTVATVEEAYKAAEPAEKCFIMGGASVYAMLIGEMDRLYVTEVHTVVEDADTFFPEIDPAIWKEESRSPVMTDPETGFAFEFVVYAAIRD